MSSAPNTGQGDASCEAQAPTKAANGSFGEGPRWMAYYSAKAAQYRAMAESYTYGLTAERLDPRPLPSIDPEETTHHYTDLIRNYMRMAVEQDAHAARVMAASIAKATQP